MSWSKIVVPIFPGQDSINEASPVPPPLAPLGVENFKVKIGEIGQPPLRSEEAETNLASPKWPRVPNLL